MPGLYLAWVPAPGLHNEPSPLSVILPQGPGGKE